MIVYKIEPTSNKLIIYYYNINENAHSKYRCMCCQKLGANYIFDIAQYQTRICLETPQILPEKVICIKGKHIWVNFTFSLTW